MSTEGRKHLVHIKNHLIFRINIPTSKSQTGNIMGARGIWKHWNASNIVRFSTYVYWMMYSTSIILLRIKFWICVQNIGKYKTYNTILIITEITKINESYVIYLEFYNNRTELQCNTNVSYVTLPCIITEIFSLI